MLFRSINSANTVQLNLRLSLRDSSATIYTQCRDISTQKGILWPRDEDYEIWLAGRDHRPIMLVVKDVALISQGVRAEDILIATLKSDRPSDISRANSPCNNAIMTIVSVWGIAFKVWPANQGNAIMFRECTIPMDATWRDVKKVIQELLEVNQFIPPHDQGWYARFQQIDIDDSWIDRKITEFGFIAQEPSRSWIHVNIPMTRPYTGLMGNLNYVI